VFAASGERSHARYLAAWDIVAAVYLLAAVAIVRDRRHERAAPVGERDVPPWLRPVIGPRAEFLSILGASVAGLTSAWTVLAHAADKDGSLAGIAAVGIVLAWVLLHAGYARFYAGLYYEGLSPAHGGVAQLEFPRDSHPTAVDFLYFSFTLGTSFATSDVTATTPGMRWHVMMHSVLSFFYNAVVLALAVRVLTSP
jgi:uncharacterized membrane protein